MRTAVQIRLLQLIRSFYAVSARAAYGSSGLNPWEKVDVYPGDCWAVRKAYHLYVVRKWKSSHSFTEVISRGKRHGM